jgi:hypothetical protein
MFLPPHINGFYKRAGVLKSVRTVFIQNRSDLLIGLRATVKRKIIMSKRMHGGHVALFGILIEKLFQ